MKTKLFQGLKIIILLFPLLTFSCSKDEIEIDYGSLASSVKLYNKNGIETFTYTDININLVDTNNTCFNIYPDLKGKFKKDSLLYGNILLTINKPGYIGVSLIYNHRKNLDTIPEIIVMEALPFSFNAFWVDCQAGWLKWHSTIEYTSNYNYLVGDFICYSRNPDVSFNNCEFSAATGFYASVNGFNNTISSSITMPPFLKYGFNYGGTIYAVDYPVSGMFDQIQYNQKKVLNIISYEMNNPSGTCSFILKN
jgi:hypothetical protein